MLFSLSGQKLGDMTRPTVYERLMKLFDAAKRDRRFSSYRHILREAEMSSGYLSELKHRCERDPESTIQLETAERLAHVLGVSVTEIQDRPPQPEPPTVDKYAERSWAIQAARALQLPESAIQRILAEDPGGEPSRLYWFRRIESEAESPPPPPGRASKRV